MNSPEFYMQLALKEAAKAAGKDEVPVGALAVDSAGNIVARAHNLMEKKKCAAAHAELLLIEKCSKKLGDWRLSDLTFFVTKEPCPMCTGALVNAHVKAVYFGIFDKKSGGISKFNLADNPALLWRLESSGGICETECLAQFRQFFAEIRKKNKKNGG